MGESLLFFRISVKNAAFGRDFSGRRAHYPWAVPADPPSAKNLENIVEDPSDRESHESFFIQLADLNAYAAAQTIRPGANIGGELWDGLGDSRILEVNVLRKGPPGIKVWPPKESPPHLI